MSWAAHAVQALAQGQTVAIRPRGHSMAPLVHDGDEVTLAPLAAEEAPAKGDIVLVKVHGRVFLHKVIAVKHGSTFLIGNNRGGLNGWVGRRSIYGKMIGKTG
jgi:phage repressor protein C with HTH and peptisase S24 domain